MKIDMALGNNLARKRSLSSECAGHTVLEVRDLERLADRPDEDGHDVTIDERQDVRQQQDDPRPMGTGLIVGRMSLRRDG